MFSRDIAIYSIAALLCLLVCAAKICIVTEKDMQVYRSRVEEYRALAQKTLTDSATQERTGVRKDIWFAQQDGSLLQYRIESERSLLTLVPQKGKFDIVEKLQNIRCWMQEKIVTSPSGPWQQIRSVAADEGTYSLSKQQFFAQSVALSLFKMPGSALLTPESTKGAFLHGNAENISFHVSGKTPQFQAHNFSASLTKEESKK